MKKKQMNSKYKKYIVTIIFLTLVLNILGCFEGFCAFYKNYIYGYIASVMGSILSPIPFAVGEILMYIGAILSIILLLQLLLLVFLRKKKSYRHFCKAYVKSFFAVACTIVFLYTINWVIPFRAPHLDVKPEINKKYSVEEMQVLRNYAVEQLNMVAWSIEREEDGKILLSEHLDADIAEAMNGIADEFPLLKGYYPHAKASLCSVFLEWMGIGGYTYPYTMEVSYNKFLDYLYEPVLLSHEQSHHKGYYQENEATFLSIIACTHSDSKYLQYAGYLEFYYYIERDYISSLYHIYGKEQAKEMLAQEPKVADIVWKDRKDSLDERQNRYEQEVSPKLENAFKSYATKASDAGWEAQGKIIKEATYGGCVKYLLEYYDGVLYE